MIPYTLYVIIIHITAAHGHLVSRAVVMSYTLWSKHTCHHCPWRRDLNGRGGVLHFVDHDGYPLGPWSHGFRGCSDIPHIVDGVHYFTG